MSGGSSPPPLLPPRLSHGSRATNASNGQQNKPTLVGVVRPRAQQVTSANSSGGKPQARHRTGQKETSL